MTSLERRGEGEGEGEKERKRERERGKGVGRGGGRDRQYRDFICEQDMLVFCTLRGTEVTQVGQRTLRKGRYQQGTASVGVQSPEAALRDLFH